MGTMANTARYSLPSVAHTTPPDIESGGTRPPIRFYIRIRAVLSTACIVISCTIRRGLVCAGLSFLASLCFSVVGLIPLCPYDGYTEVLATKAGRRAVFCGSSIVGGTAGAVALAYHSKRMWEGKGERPGDVQKFKNWTELASLLSGTIAPAIGAALLAPQPGIQAMDALTLAMTGAWTIVGLIVLCSLIDVYGG
ncbi:hypothetical protein C8Q74DRAFT_1250557 [Fomes fomentarius]|nr:hypothetical protein C8Q74DRAFT_1250557 [Fomes fomentarius]